MKTNFFPKLYLLAAVGALALLVAAYYFEYVLGLKPCPLCMTQRLCVLLVGVCFFFASVKLRFVSLLMLVLALIASLAGLYIADHQVYLQSLPPEQAPACGPDLAYMLKALPFDKFLSLLLQGDGNCAKVVWSFLGLSMPKWTRICFTIYTLFAMVSLYVTLRANKQTA